MAFYDTYGDSQKRRLEQQSQNNQAFQEFANFLQKQQMVRPENNLRNAQSNYYGSQAQGQNLTNQIAQLKISQYLQQQGMIPPVQTSQNPNIQINQGAGGQTAQYLTPQQLASQQNIGGLRPIQKESEDLFGNKTITPEYQQYQKDYLNQRNVDIKNRQIEVAKELQKLKGSDQQPMTSDSAGRYAFASEAKRNLPKLKSLLVKEDGTWNEGLANKLTYPWKYPKDKETQNAKRWIVGAMTARGLIQSGTVVKDNEWGRLLQQFGIDLLNDPQASISSIDENMNFMDEYQRLIRPGSKGSVSQSDVVDFSDNDVSDLLEGF